jgi:hypothetical protein
MAGHPGIVSFRQLTASLKFLDFWTVQEQGIRVKRLIFLNREIFGRIVKISKRYGRVGRGLRREWNQLLRIDGVGRG